MPVIYAGCCLEIVENKDSTSGAAAVSRDGGGCGILSKASLKCG